MFNNELLKPFVAKRTNLPIPIELVVIVGGTLLSKYMKMHETWAIIPVGNIPVGLPEAIIPKFSLWKELLVDSFAIAFVSYSVTVSMALIFGQKLKYEIDFNQELLAMVRLKKFPKILFLTLNLKNLLKIPFLCVRTWYFNEVFKFYLIKMFFFESRWY